eukprot:1141661-Pelagomonas_calceolata.AAC.8
MSNEWCNGFGDVPVYFICNLNINITMLVRETSPCRQATTEGLSSKCGHGLLGQVQCYPENKNGTRIGAFRITHSSS